MPRNFRVFFCRRNNEVMVGVAASAREIVFCWRVVQRLKMRGKIGLPLNRDRGGRGKKIVGKVPSRTGKNTTGKGKWGLGEKSQTFPREKSKMHDVHVVDEIERPWVGDDEVRENEEERKKKRRRGWWWWEEEEAQEEARPERPLFLAGRDWELGR